MGSLYRRGKIWQAQYTDGRGRRRQRSTGVESKAVAKQMLAAWELNAAKQRAGLTDPAADRTAAHLARPIGEHIDEFADVLKSRGRSDKHISATADHCRWIAATAGWLTLRDITADGLTNYMASQRDAGDSARTMAAHAQSAKSFARWCVQTHRMHADPLASVRKPNPDRDRRLRRRMLRHDEWPWLRDASGERAMLYEFAILTGLRPGEIRRLRPGDCHFTAEPPYVLAPSDSTKNADKARQYVTADFASRAAAAGPATRKRQFAIAGETEAAEVIRRDLAAARAAWIAATPGVDPGSDFLRPINDAGETWDFYALRHTCGAWMAARGVPIKTVLSVMRHKSITLTMDTYGHLYPDATAQAVAGFADDLNQVSISKPSADSSVVRVSPGRS